MILVSPYFMARNTIPFVFTNIQNGLFYPRIPARLRICFGKRFELPFRVPKLPLRSGFTVALSAGQPVLLLLHAVIDPPMVVSKTAQHK
jgi:hypothetical protein